MKLYAIMMSYGELPFLKFVIERLLTFCDHLVVMDNGSVDGSREWLLRLRDKRVKLILNQQTNPPHYGRLCNLMLKHVPNGAWALKWDPDQLPSDNMVSDLRGVIEDGEDSFAEEPPVAWGVPIYHLMKSRYTCLPREYGTTHPYLFKKLPGVMYRGHIHERIQTSGPHGVIDPESGIAVIHLGHLAEARLRRKAIHYASIEGSSFKTPEDLTSSLDLEVLPLPAFVSFRADDTWLESIRGIE